MKIIRVIEAGERLTVDFHPDSAMLLAGRPFFMPEFGHGWSARIKTALRICRLGKNIGERFAGRYFDAVAPALHIFPSDSTMDSGLLSALDSSIVIGEWHNSDILEAPRVIEFEEIHTSLPPSRDLAEQVISHVSQYSTLKMGDIILLPEPLPPLPLRENTRFQISLNFTPSLDLKIV